MSFLVPYGLRIGSGRCVGRDGHTAVRALSGDGVAFLKAVGAVLVRRLLELCHEALEGVASGSKEEAEVLLGVAGGEDGTLLAECPHMILEALHNAGVEGEELHLESGAHGHDFLPLLLLVQLVHILLPGKLAGEGCSNYGSHFFGRRSPKRKSDYKRNSCHGCS